MSSRKRSAQAAADAAADSARGNSRARHSARSSPRVAGSPALNYNEDAAGDLGPVLADVAERQFWERFDTQLLWAWIADYKRKDIEMTAALKGDRDELLRILVQNANDWVQRPAVGKELETMQDVWKLRAKPHRLDPTPAWFAQPIAAAQRADEAPASMEPEAPTPAKKGKKKAKKPIVVDSESDGERDGDDDDQMVFLSPSKAPAQHALAFPPIGAAVPQHIPPTTFMVCPHCLCKNGGQTEASFECVVCKLLTGLPATHRLNELRMSTMAGPRAPAAAAAAASSSASASGQLLTDIFEGSSATQRREKELKEILKLAANPAFDDLPVGALFPHTAALEVGRQAYNAPAYEQPSPLLLQAIRKGVLYKLGFAKPRLLSEAASLRHGITLEGGALTAAVGSTPKLESLEDFCFSMFSTILPALVDKPKALAEWLALGRTALEIHTLHKKGWSAVSNYLDQFLAERTFAAKPYADISLQIMTSTVLLAPTTSQQFGARGPQQAPPSGNKFCTDYNFRATGCTRDPCPYKHECQYGSLGCRDTRGHRAFDCSFKQPNLALKGGTPRGKKPRGDAESVQSAPMSGAGAPPKKGGN